jgi:hypothetical protein
MFLFVLHAGATIPKFPEGCKEELSHGAELRHGGALARFLQFRGSRAWSLIGAAGGQRKSFQIRVRRFFPGGLFNDNRR